MYVERNDGASVRVSFHQEYCSGDWVGLYLCSSADGASSVESVTSTEYAVARRNNWKWVTRGVNTCIFDFPTSSVPCGLVQAKYFRSSAVSNIFSSYACVQSSNTVWIGPKLTFACKSMSDEDRDAKCAGEKRVTSTTTFRATLIVEGNISSAWVGIYDEGAANDSDYRHYVYLPPVPANIRCEEIVTEIPLPRVGRWWVRVFPTRYPISSDYVVADVSGQDMVAMRVHPTDPQQILVTVHLGTINPACSDDRIAVLIVHSGQSSLNTPYKRFQWIKSSGDCSISFNAIRQYGSYSVRLVNHTRSQLLAESSDRLNVGITFSAPSSLNTEPE